MKWIQPENSIEIVWGWIKLSLLVCSFFWFGWEVGVLMIIMNINIK